MSEETTALIDATVTVGVPKGLDPEAVRRRKALLMRAGVDPLLAEGLAVSAETEQALLDERVAAEERARKAAAKAAAKAAQKAEPNQNETQTEETK